MDRPASIDAGNAEMDVIFWPDNEGYHPMRTLPIFTVAILITLALVSSVSGATKTRLLQEAVAPGQRLERLHGLPVIISEKKYAVILMPETILLETATILQFNLVVSNGTGGPLSFSLDQLTAYSSQGKLKILSPDEVIANSRKFYSHEEYNISKEQEKALTPYVEEKMADLRKKLLQSRTIEPGENTRGIIDVEVPFGTEAFTIEVVTDGESHKFEFNVGEF